MIDIVGQNCETKLYMKNLTLHEARHLFKIRTHMNKLKGNYKNNKQNKITKYKCEGCKTETKINSHVLICPAYEYLRKTQVTCLKSDKGIVKYFSKVMEVRSGKDRE